MHGLHLMMSVKRHSFYRCAGAAAMDSENGSAGSATVVADEADVKSAAVQRDPDHVDPARVISGETTRARPAPIVTEQAHKMSLIRLDNSMGGGLSGDGLDALGGMGSGRALRIGSRQRIGSGGALPETPSFRLKTVSTPRTGDRPRTGSEDAFTPRFIARTRAPFSDGSRSLEGGLTPQTGDPGSISREVSVLRTQVQGLQTERDGLRAQTRSLQNENHGMCLQIEALEQQLRAQPESNDRDTKESPGEANITKVEEDTPAKSAKWMQDELLDGTNPEIENLRQFRQKLEQKEADLTLWHRTTRAELSRMQRKSPFSFGSRQGSESFGGSNHPVPEGGGAQPKTLARLDTWVFDPRHSCMFQCFAFVLVAFAVIGSIEAPFIFAFSSAPTGWWHIEGAIADAIFAIDLFVGPFKGYVDTSTLLLVQDFKASALQYARTWLVPSILAAFPITTISAPGGVPTAWGLFRVLRLVVVFRDKFLFTTIEKTLSTPSVVRLVRTLLSFSLIIHWIACSYW